MPSTACPSQGSVTCNAGRLNGHSPVLDRSPAYCVVSQDYNDGDGAPLPYANTCTLNVSKCSPGDLMDYIDDTGSADPVTLEFVNATSDAAVEAVS